MKLYSAETSPYARKVRILLHETGQFGDVEIVPAYGTPLDPQTMPLAQNPLGKLPALERADGPAIYDSRVICRYLDARAGGKLYPEGNRLWETLTLEATADGILDAAILMVYEVRVRPEDKRMPDWVDGQWAKIARAVEAISGRWMSHLNGPLDMGQIAVACALGYLDFRHPTRDWRTGNEALAAWYKQFAERESFNATVPPAA
ncbi:MAG: glutathione S-transferase [Paracoccaceae bacterium]